MTVTATVSVAIIKLRNWIIRVIVLVLVVGSMFYYLNGKSSASGAIADLAQKSKYDLTRQDMEVLFQEMMPPDKQQEIATNPEEKKKLIDQIKKLLAVAQAADEEGYSQRPEVKAQTELQTDLQLNQAYRKNHPEMIVSDDQINAYHQSHPSDFDNFLQSNLQFQQRAQGPQREQFRKQYGEFKIVADLARKEGLEEDKNVRLEILLGSSQILQIAYLNDFGQNAGTLISGKEVEQYYNEHIADFEEVRVRHVLISTQPPNADASDGKVGGKNKPEPKQLTAAQARRKAQAILVRARRGENFARLARLYSDDPGSKDKGGEYNFLRGVMVPEFENAAFALKPGQISNLVETPFGFHIIKLEARRPGPPPSDPKIRQQIVDKLKDYKINDRINELARKSKIVVPEDFDTTIKPQPKSPVRSKP
jgi:DNA uptake protein ComE-like DNA-binding protein